MSSIAERNRIIEIERRVEQLESTFTKLIDARRYASIGQKNFEKLEQHNRDKQAYGAALRAEIQRVSQELDGTVTAKRVLEQISLERIGRVSPPSVRTVQWHLQHLKPTPQAL